MNRFEIKLCALLPLFTVLILCNGRSDKNNRTDGEVVSFANIGKQAPNPLGRSVWENTNWQNKNTTISINKKDYFPRKDTSPQQGEKITKYKNQSMKEVTPKNMGGDGVAVLCYHHNFPGKKNFDGFNVSPKKLEKQFRYLVEHGYQSISLEQLDRHLKGENLGLVNKPVVISFDDGLKSNLTVVLPLLKKYNLKAVLFIYPGIISTKTKNHLNWKQLRKLAHSGHFEIGSHSLNHPRLPEHSQKEIRRQLVRSKNILEKKLKTKIISFAYPFGIYDKKVIREIKSAGYKLAFTIHSGQNSKTMNRFTLNRYMVTTSHSLEYFAKNLKLKSKAIQEIVPRPGSRIKSGDIMSLHLPGYSDIKIKLAGKKLKHSIDDGIVIARLPKTKSKLGYLTLQIKAKDSNDNPVFREILYLDAKKFKR